MSVFSRDRFQYNPYVIYFNCSQAFSICQTYDDRFEFDRGRPLTPAELIFAASEISSAAEVLEILKENPPFFKQITLATTYQDPVLFAHCVLQFLPVLRLALHLGPLVYAIGDRERAEHTVTLANHLCSILCHFLEGNHPLVAVEWIATHHRNILAWPEMEFLGQDDPIEESVEIDFRKIDLIGETTPECICNMEARLIAIVESWTRQQNWNGKPILERDVSPESWVAVSPENFHSLVC